MSEKELVSLTLAIVAINGWNRLAINFRTVPGTYQHDAKNTGGSKPRAPKVTKASTQPMTRSTSDISRRARQSNKQLNIASGPPATKPPQRLGLPASRRVRRTEQAPLVLTAGHSTRTLKDFVALLLAHDVKQLIDVRTIPRSRHNPQFNQGRLPRPLQKAGIRYRHMAGLGGLRNARRDSTNTAWRNASFRGFADYMQTPEFEEALDQLIHWAQKRRTVIMCAEAVPWRCHRSMIGDALLARGIRVEEIASRSRTRPHTLTPWALVKRKRVSYPASLKRSKAVGRKAA